MVQFNATPEEARLINEIASRAIAKGLCDRKDRLNLEMDITACHCSGAPLRLQELLNAAYFDFTHDVCGISRYLNRITGELHSHFLPRYAVSDAEYGKMVHRMVLEGGAAA